MPDDSDVLGDLMGEDERDRPNPRCALAHPRVNEFPLLKRPATEKSCVESGWIPVDAQMHRLGATHNQRLYSDVSPVKSLQHGCGVTEVTVAVSVQLSGGYSGGVGGLSRLGVIGSGRLSEPPGTTPRPERRPGRPAGDSFRRPLATLDRSHPISQDRSR